MIKIYRSRGLKMKLRRKNASYEEPVDIICNYIYNIEEIKDKMV